jgi:5-formyltetrahydrofolate cyclo-ligase
MADLESPREAKQRMRAAAKQDRAAAFARSGSAAAERLAAIGLAFAAAPVTAIVSAFSAIGDEINPFPLLSKLIHDGHPACLPAMQGKGLPLVFRAWKPGDPLDAGVWGIHEPLPSAPVLDPDILLVPLLAFDTHGYRLGYGGGFYDRTLAGLRMRKRVVAVGLAFDEQRVDVVPHTPMTSASTGCSRRPDRFRSARSDRDEMPRTAAADGRRHRSLAVVAQPPRRRHFGGSPARQLCVRSMTLDDYPLRDRRRPELVRAPPRVQVGRPGGRQGVNAAAAHRVVTGGGEDRPRAFARSVRRRRLPSVRACRTKRPGSVHGGRDEPGRADRLDGSRGRGAVQLQEQPGRLNAAARDVARSGRSRTISGAGGSSWMVITERPGSGRSPSEVAVRSSPGAEGLQRALNEQGSQGYRADLLWKEGNDFVALMSRPIDGSNTPVTYAAEAADRSSIHALSKLYVADFPISELISD